ncbi:MAG: TorD/DmsD family molecular chaperone [Geminicoccaceae bacterium]
MLAAEASTDETLPEERLRAHQYQLLARFLAAPPEADLLDLASSFAGDDTELGRALAELADRAGQATPEAASREYHELFIGIGRGELVPYASYYLTGFLNEKPLAKLRGDMARLGMARADTVKEPEDHIAALCEMMAGLITGAFGGPLDLAAQRAFFDRHLAPWAPVFFEDLEKAKSAWLYAPVGTLGRVFMGIEKTAFMMET